MRGPGVENGDIGTTSQPCRRYDSLWQLLEKQPGNAMFSVIRQVLDETKALGGPDSEPVTNARTRCVVGRCFRVVLIRGPCLLVRQVNQSDELNVARRNFFSAEQAGVVARRR